MEEHDSATSLIAAVEAGRGVALVSQRLDCLAGPRLKIRPIHPAPPPLVIGVAHRKQANSMAAEKFLIALKRSNGAKDTA